ncbi:unnamed protein product [Lota lota]
MKECQLRSEGARQQQSKREIDKETEEGGDRRIDFHPERRSSSQFKVRYKVQGREGLERTPGWLDSPKRTKLFSWLSVIKVYQCRKQASPLGPVVLTCPTDPNPGDFWNGEEEGIKIRGDEKE